jgi:glycosyltransferase involved in cell wall biosynthesis
MTTTEPTVSFVVPARNEVDYLPATLDSIADQNTSIPYEVIVADGGSTDGTREVARERGEAMDVPFEVVEEAGDAKEGHGIAAGRNRGAQAATGEWLAFIDADTVLEECYLEKMYGFVESEGVDIASSHAEYRHNSDWRVKLLERMLNNYCLSFTKPIYPGFNIFVNAEIFDAVRGFPDVPAEDYAFSRAIAEIGETGILEEPVVTTSARRVHDRGAIGTAVYYLRLWWRYWRTTDAEDRHRGSGVER